MVEKQLSTELQELVACVPEWAQASAYEKALLAESPPGGDEYLRAYGRAALELYGSDPEYLEIMESRLNGTIQVSARKEDHEVAHNEQEHFHAYQRQLNEMYRKKYQ